MEGSQAGGSGGHTATKLISSTLYSLEKVGKVGGGRGEGVRAAKVCWRLRTLDSSLDLTCSTTGSPEWKSDYDPPTASLQTNFINPRNYFFFLLMKTTIATKTQPSLSCALLQSQKWLPASSLPTLCSLLSLGYSLGPPGSVSQSVSERVCEAGASPAVVGLQCPRLHDVKAYR